MQPDARIALLASSAGRPAPQAWSAFEASHSAMTTSRGSTPGSVLDRHLKAHALFTLKVVDDVEQVPRLRVAFRPEHPHQAFCRDVRELAQALEAHRAVDVVPQQRLARVDIAGEQAVDRLLQDGFSEAGRPEQAGTNGLFEVFRQWHGSDSLSPFVVLPAPVCVRNVAGLTFLAPAAEQDHHGGAVLAEIHPQAGTEVDPRFEDTTSDTFHGGSTYCLTVITSGDGNT